MNFVANIGGSSASWVRWGRTLRLHSMHGKTTLQSGDTALQFALCIEFSLNNPSPFLLLPYSRFGMTHASSWIGAFRVWALPGVAWPWRRRCSLPIGTFDRCLRVLWFSGPACRPNCGPSGRRRCSPRIHWRRVRPEVRPLSRAGAWPARCHRHVQAILCLLVEALRPLLLRCLDGLDQYQGAFQVAGALQGWRVDALDGVTSVTAFPRVLASRRLRSAQPVVVDEASRCYSICRPSRSVRMK